jgi:ligand-binding sensor domain-containing protein
LKKHRIISATFTVLATVCLTSCDGQIQNSSSKDQAKIINTEKVGYTKLKKTQWAKDYDQICASLKDSKGRLWFGTSGGGVYCYDGKLFRQYTTDDGLSHNDVGAIYEDTKGLIWFGTADGVTTWNGKTFTKVSITTLRGAFAKPYQPTTTVNGFVSQENEIFDIAQDSKGHFWFAADKAIYRYDGKIFTNFTVNDGIVNRTGIDIGWIEKILEDADGKIWFGGRASKGVFCYDGKTLINNQEWALKATPPNLIPRVKDIDGNIWFSNWNILVRYSKDKVHTFTRKESFLQGSPFGGYKDHNDNLWFPVENRENGCGICKYDGKKFEYFPIISAPTEKIAGTIVEDKEGNLWVGTTGSELYRFDGKAFTLYSE